jgi:glycosyltransferase involved in cell wall biosynthesis
MKIAIPIIRFDKSGGIRALTVLANGLSERGYEVCFVVPKEQHTPTFELNQKISVRVVKPNFGTVQYLSGSFKLAQLVYGMPKVDIAIANSFVTAYPVKVCQLIGLVKYPFYFVQAYEPLAFGEWAKGSVFVKKMKMNMARLTYLLGLNCIANSRWVANMLAAYHEIQPLIVSLGVDTNVFYPNNNGEHATTHERIMTIGNSNPIKQFYLFYLVLRELQKSISCEAIIATDEKSLKIDDGIEQHWFYPEDDFELARVYNLANLFLSTSYLEGYGLPLLEAMACGIPVVTTDSGGIHEFCQDGLNCRIVQSSNPADIAEVVLEVLLDQSLRAKIVKNGQVTAKEFHWKKMVDGFDRQFQTLEYQS